MSDYNRNDDLQAARRREQWSLPAGVIYLNHGSFGPSTKPVQEACAKWQRRLESEPLDFLVRQLADHLVEARRRIGTFLGADPDDLLFAHKSK